MHALRQCDDEREKEPLSLWEQAFQLSAHNRPWIHDHDLSRTRTNVLTARIEYRGLWTRRGSWVVVVEWSGGGWSVGWRSHSCLPQAVFVDANTSHQHLPSHPPYDLKQLRFCL